MPIKTRSPRAVEALDVQVEESGGIEVLCAVVSGVG